MTLNRPSANEAAQAILDDLEHAPDRIADLCREMEDDSVTAETHLHNVRIFDFLSRTGNPLAMCDPSMVLVLCTTEVYRISLWSSGGRRCDCLWPHLRATRQ